MHSLLSLCTQNTDTHSRRLLLLDDQLCPESNYLSILAKRGACAFSQTCTCVRTLRIEKHYMKLVIIFLPHKSNLNVQSGSKIVKLRKKNLNKFLMIFRCVVRQANCCCCCHDMPKYIHVLLEHFLIPNRPRTNSTH